MSTGALGNPSKWHSANSYNMQMAKTLSANMLKRVRANEEAERASKNAEMEQTAREKQQQRDAVFAKAAAHGDVISTSSKCMRDAEDGLLNTDNSLALLRQNRALAFASLQVCKRRTQLRDRRPKTELIKDYVTIALESEQKLLEAARDEFLQMEAEGKKVNEDLTTMRLFLSQDTGSRRLCMKKDAQSLRPHLEPPADKQRPPPEINEGASRTMLEDTFQLLERSNKHRERTIAAVARIKEESRAAVVRTESCLEKRTDELTVLEKELKAHMNDCDSAIAVSERSLDKSNKRLDPTDAGKKEKLIRDAAVMEQLKKHKDKLHAEIQNKFIALEIDNMCRRVTPIKACEPSLLDANNAQSTQRAQSSPGLTNSASAPSLLSAAGTSNVGGKKLPPLGGTMDSFSRDKYSSASPKFGASLTSNTSSGAPGAAKVKR